MGVKVVIGPSAATLSRLESLYGSGKRSRTNRILQSAVSATITTGVTMIARRIGEEVNLPIGDIKSSISARRGSYTDPTGYIDITRGKSVWMDRYLSSGARRSAAEKVKNALRGNLTPRGGVKIKPRKRSSGKYPAGTQTLPKAFVAVTPNSTFIGVFERVGVKRVMKSGKYAGKVREVIRRLKGPTPFGVFKNAVGQEGAATLVDEVKIKLTDAFKKNIVSKMKAAEAGFIK